MRRTLKILITMAFAGILFTACTKESNPLDPNDPGTGNGDPTIIQTPKSLKITSIVLWNFPTTKPGGEKWDFHVFSNSPTRRPDVYVSLAKGSNSPVYTSDIHEDAEFETAYDNFVFTQPQVSGNRSLPYSIPINETYTINVWDDDGLSADDLMGSVSIYPDPEYKDDNATFFFKTITNGGTTIEIKGQWVY